MLDDAANIEQGKFRQACVAIACEQVLTILPDGLVYVHAGTVVAHNRLGHESSRLAINTGHIVPGVFQNPVPVGAINPGDAFGADFKMTRSGDFVVMHLDRSEEPTSDLQSLMS